MYKPSHDDDSPSSNSPETPNTAQHSLPLQKEDLWACYVRDPQELQDNYHELAGISKYFGKGAKEPARVGRLQSPDLWHLRFVRNIKNGPSSEHSRLSTSKPGSAREDEDTSRFDDVHHFASEFLPKDYLKDPEVSCSDDSDSSNTVSAQSFEGLPTFKANSSPRPLQCTNTAQTQNNPNRLKHVRPAELANDSYQTSSGDELADVLRMDSKFQRVLSRRLFSQGKKSTRVAKRRNSGPKLNIEDGDLSFKSRIRTQPKAVKSQSELQARQAPRVSKTTANVNRCRTSVDEPQYISNSSEEDERLAPVATKLASKCRTSRVTLQSSARGPSSSKYMLTTANQSLDQPFKRKRSEIIMINDSSEDNDDFEDEFRAKRLRIQKTLHGGVEGRRPRGFLVTRTERTNGEDGKRFGARRT